MMVPPEGSFFTLSTPGVKTWCANRNSQPQWVWGGGGIPGVLPEFPAWKDGKPTTEASYLGLIHAGNSGPGLTWWTSDLRGPLNSLTGRGGYRWQRWALAGVRKEPEEWSSGMEDTGAPASWPKARGETTGVSNNCSTGDPGGQAGVATLSRTPMMRTDRL